MLIKPRENRLELLAAAIGLLLVVLLTNVMGSSTDVTTDGCPVEESFLSRSFSAIVKASSEGRLRPLKTEAEPSPEVTEDCEHAEAATACDEQQAVRQLCVVNRGGLS